MEAQQVQEIISTRRIESSVTTNFANLACAFLYFCWLLDIEIQISSSECISINRVSFYFYRFQTVISEMFDSLVIAFILSTLVMGWSFKYAGLLITFVHIG